MQGLQRMHNRRTYNISWKGQVTIMITKKLGIIGCGNMGGAILYGALESGVIAKENVFVYDINPSMRNKASDWGVTVSANDAEV